MKLCGEQQSFVTLLVQYHKAVLSLFIKMFIGKKCAVAMAWWNSPLACRMNSIMGFIPQITHVQTHIHLGWEVRQRNRKVEAETMIERKSAIFLKKTVELLTEKQIHLS